MAVMQRSIKKRQVIANSNRTMFMWVAGMSAIVGICLVLAVFLFQQLAFQTKVANKLDQTAGVLRDNNQKTTQLMDNLRARSADSGLNAVKANPDDQPLQVVLDALPADNNTLALGASLQKKLLSDLNGVTLESLSVDPQQTAGETTDVTATDETTGDVQQMPVSFVISSDNPNNLKDALVRLERSLRVIDIDALHIEASSNKYTMTVDAHAYYEPAKTVQLENTTCTPKGKGC